MAIDGIISRVLQYHMIGISKTCDVVDFNWDGMAAEQRLGFDVLQRSNNLNHQGFYPRFLQAEQHHSVSVITLPFDAFQMGDDEDGITIQTEPREKVGTQREASAYWVTCGVQRVAQATKQARNK